MDANSNGPKVPRKRWREVGLVLLLMIFVAGLRCWQVQHTVVTSRDSIAFLHYAWRLDRESWQDVIGNGRRHPGYPVAIYAVSGILPSTPRLTEPQRLQLAAQITSSLAAVLLVLPLYGLGRAWFGPAVAAGGVLLFNCLPAGGLILADGLSEGVFLLFAVSALWAATLGLSTSSPLLLSFCGIFSGLAYLTRPEGILIATAAGAVLLGLHVFSRRISWTRLSGCTAALTLATILACLPLVAVTGRLTAKPTPTLLFTGGVQAPRLDTLAALELQDVYIREWAKVLLPKPRRTDCQSVLPCDKTSSPTPVTASRVNVRLAHGTFLAGRQLIAGLFFYLWIPALLGAWWCRQRLREIPGLWVFLLAAGGIFAMLAWIASRLDYASERHLILVTLGITIMAAAGLRELATRLSWRPRAVFAVLLVLACAGPLVKSLRPLHPDRAGCVDAGLWLAQHTHTGDVILDPHGWTVFHSGHAFEEQLLPPAAGQGGTMFVVLDASPSERSKLPTLPLLKRLADLGGRVYQAPIYERNKRHVELTVFAVPLPSRL